MGAEERARVLHAGLALDVALEEVADRRRDRDPDADQQRVALRQPRLVEAREPDADDRATMPITRPSTVLRARSTAPAGGARKAPAEVGAGVADERPDQRVDDDAAAVRQAAQQHRVGERDPIHQTPSSVAAIP